MSEKKVIWKDRKRTFCGLPWSFTVYQLTAEKLLITTGFLSKKEEEIRLYRIMDVTLRQSFWDRIWGVGTIRCDSADRSTPQFDILHVKHSRDVKEKLSDYVEKERQKKRVAAREFMSEGDMDDGDGDMMDNDLM